MYPQRVCTVIFLWILTTGICAANSVHPCPDYCTCKPKKQAMDCDGKDGILTFIPRPPGYVKRFGLRNANLGQLTKEKARNLTFCNISDIYLGDNNITYFSSDALSELKYLLSFKWDQKYLPVLSLGLALKNMPSALSSLMLYANTIDGDTVWASSFQHLTTLRTFRINIKEMKVFNTSGLGHMTELTLLDLANNQLEDFTLKEVVPRLEILGFDQNDLVSLPSLCLDANKPMTPKLVHLSLHDNAIRNLDTSGISCLEHLSKIDLSQTRIEHLNNNVFATLPVLSDINLSQLTSLRKVDDLAFNSASLTKIVLKENPSLSLKKFNPRIIFTRTPKLTSLDMTNTKLAIGIEDLKQLLLTLRNITHLTLERTHIEVLPVGVFSNLPYLNHLTLSGNYFYGWDERVFANVTSIKRIFLDGCNINIINETSFPLEFRLNVQEIDLGNNPFTCTCDLLWFRTWMKNVIANKSITFSQYPYRYDCRSPNIGPLKLADFNPTLQSCTISQLYFVILVIVLSVCIVVTVSGLLTYRYRWYILYWISLVRRQRQRQQHNLEAPTELEYDGFVSYDNSDWDWVSSELLDFLEGQLGLRLCEHSRDFKPGMYIIDNIIEAMETSRKTILVISIEYMKSDWCQFELQMALSSYLKNELELIVILLEHIRSCHVTSSLRALMVSTTYIEWSDDEEAKRLFRERLQNAMRQ